MDGSRQRVLPQMLSTVASRRRSLAGLLPGLAAGLAAASSTETTAKRRKKKCKSGANECQTQTEPCISVLTRKCAGQGDPEQCETDFLPCCEFLASCNAAAAMECLLQDL